MAGGDRSLNSCRSFGARRESTVNSEDFDLELAPPVLFNILNDDPRACVEPPDNNLKSDNISYSYGRVRRDYNVRVY